MYMTWCDVHKCCCKFNFCLFQRQPENNIHAKQGSANGFCEGNCCICICWWELKKKKKTNNNLLCLTDMSNIDLCNQLWSSIWLSGHRWSVHLSCLPLGKASDSGHCRQTDFSLSQIFSHLQCILAQLSNSNLYHGGDLDFSWGSQGQQKAKLVGFFLIHKSILWIYVMSHVRLSVWPARSLCMAKTLMFDITSKLFKQIFRTCLFIGMTDFYQFIPLALTLTMAGGHKVTVQQYLVVSFSHTLCNWSGWNLMWFWCNSSWTPWYYYWVRFSAT